MAVNSFKTSHRTFENFEISKPTMYPVYLNMLGQLKLLLVDLLFEKLSIKY